MTRRALNYRDYLRLDRLLACQAPVSGRGGPAAPDELLFIIVHQAYELWFKQILFELGVVQAEVAAPVVDDRAMGGIVHRLGRIAEIQGLLLRQLDVLATMTPLDFLEFRDRLFPASGAQSLQFRLIETRLGLRAADRVGLAARPPAAGLGAADRRVLRRAEAEPSLCDRVEAWLERPPFVETGGYAFRDSYRQAVRDMLEGDAAVMRAGKSGRGADLAALEAARRHFDALFDEAAHAALVAAGQWRFSARALQAALFINLYRDEPALQLPFRLLSLLMDIDENLTAWRYRHALLVQRMIGLKVGTGGSSGHDYLRQTADRHRVFKDLFALSTFLIPRSRLPALPAKLRRAMGYRYAEGGR